MSTSPKGSAELFALPHHPHLFSCWHTWDEHKYKTEQTQREQRLEIGSKKLPHLLPQQIVPGSSHIKYHVHSNLFKALAMHWMKKTTHVQWELDHCLLVSGEAPALCYKKQQINTPCLLLRVHLFWFPRCDSLTKWKRHSSVASQGISISAVLLSADPHVRSLKLKLKPCCYPVSLPTLCACLCQGSFCICRKSIAFSQSLSFLSFLYP